MSDGGVVSIGGEGLKTVANYTELRALSSMGLGDVVWVAGYATNGDGGQGVFECTASSGGVAADDDDGIVIVNSTTGHVFRRAEYTNITRINVNWFGVLASSNSARVDVHDNLVQILERYPQNPLLFPATAGSWRYHMSPLDVMADPDRQTQEDNLQNKTSAQKPNWEYCPDWLGEGGIGEPEEDGTTFSAFNNSQEFVIKFSRRGNPRSMYGRIEKIRFYGYVHSSDFYQVKRLLWIEDCGFWLTIEECQFRYADVGLHLVGAFYLNITNCKFGARAHNDTQSSKFLKIGILMWDGEGHCSGQQVTQCMISVDHCGVLSDNRMNTSGSPGVGDYFRGCDFENNSRLTLYYLHCGFSWIPCQTDACYFERNPAQDPDSGDTNDPFVAAGGQVDLSRWDRSIANGFAKDLTEAGLSAQEESLYGTVEYAETPQTATSRRQPIYHIGRGWWKHHSINCPLSLLTDPQAKAIKSGTPGDPSLDRNGPVVELYSDRSDTDHTIDAYSTLRVQVVHPVGAGGGTRNVAAHVLNKGDDSLDEPGCSRIDDIFSHIDDSVVNNFKGLINSDHYYIEAGGAGTITEMPGDSPIMKHGTKVLLPAGTGNDEELHIGGTVGTPPTRNYLAQDPGVNLWNVLAFHIRATEDQVLPLVLYPRISRRQGIHPAGSFQQPIVINDYNWHAYAIHTEPGQGTHSYFLRKPAADPQQEFVIGDTQQVAFERRDAMDEFIDRRGLAILDGDSTNQPIQNPVSGRFEMLAPNMAFDAWAAYANAMWGSSDANRVVVSNAIRNGNFENWTGVQNLPKVTDTPNHWGTGGSPSIEIHKEVTPANVLSGNASLRLVGGNGGHAHGSSNNCLVQDTGGQILLDEDSPYYVEVTAKRLSGTGKLAYSFGFLTTGIEFPEDVTGDWQTFRALHNGTIHATAKELWLSPDGTDVWILDSVLVFSTRGLWH